jgi:leader peptidase (prepilin peptidase) / N-methyltransferase
LELVVVIVISLLIASFINVVAIRLPEDESVSYPPSHCPSCKHELNWKDLIPVLSYLYLRGKCRYCQVRISPFYPLGELFTASMMVVTYTQVEWGLSLAIAMVFTILLAAVTLTDFRTMLIPDVLLLVGSVVLLPLMLFDRPQEWLDMLLGAIIGGGVIAIFVYGSLWILKKEGMGLGDLKFMIVAGAVLGAGNTVLTLILASFIGGLVGMILILTRIATRESYIPFGPFLALAAWVSYLWGPSIIDWYMNLYI